MSLPKKKLLLLQETITPYRFPIYNLIAKHFRFSVAYINKAKGTEELPADFQLIQLHTRTFFVYRWIKGLRALCNKYDAVITLPYNFRCTNLCLVPFFKNNYAALTWSIGIRASYIRPYSIDQSMNWRDRIYGAIMKKADANIFYMDAPVKKWVERGIDKDKIFVAHNTVEVLPVSPSHTNKQYFLFVGTLYKQKGVDILIDAYHTALAKSTKSNFPKLMIVGSGSEEQTLKQMVCEYRLENQIQFLGAIYEESELAKLFTKSIICISPNQAGLSVLKSMGYGVPYVTHKDAITGGEILNIKNGENGIVYNTSDDLVDILYEAYADTAKYIEMGKNAYNYYHQYATPQIMADGVIHAVEYALQKRKPA